MPPPPPPPPPQPPSPPLPQSPPSPPPQSSTTASSTAATSTLLSGSRAARSASHDDAAAAVAVAPPDHDNSLAARLSRALSDVPTPPTQSLSALPTPRQLATVFDAVVKVYTTHCEPNYELPWQKAPQTTSASTGFVIPRRRILTNAHSVHFNTVVQVRRRTDDVRYVARVLAIGEECDLALLTVDSPEFWNAVSPLPFGRAPSLQDAVTVVGYPVGGDNISVTAGVTSRVELRYFSSANSFLTIQIDAAINPGNSGGPAFNHSNEVVGVAFQKLTRKDADNIGYLIAVNVVRRFLDDFDRQGRYVGSCVPGFRWQTLQDKSIRKYLRMGESHTGVRVIEVDHRRSAHGVLRRGDIVTHVDGRVISNAGTIPSPSGEPISFHSLVVEKSVGDRLMLGVVRDGDDISVAYDAPNSLENEVVPACTGQQEPDFFIVAGLLFVALTEPYLRSGYTTDWTRRAPLHLSELAINGTDEPVTEVVLLAQVLLAEINVEYANIVDQRVHAFNDERVHSLRHLAQLVAECQDDYIRFELEYHVMVVLNRKEAAAATATIMRMHHIPHDCRLTGENGDVVQCSDALVGKAAANADPAAAEEPVVEAGAKAEAAAAPPKAATNADLMAAEGGAEGAVAAQPAEGSTDDT